MAGARRSARERGKSDPIDAEAVAWVALREPDLPKACPDGPSRDIKLLVDHRRTLVAQRTAIGDKLRWFLHELDPELAVASRGLRRLCVLDHLAQALIQPHGTLAAIAAELAADCRRPAPSPSPRTWVTAIRWRAWSTVDCRRGRVERGPCYLTGRGHRQDQDEGPASAAARISDRVYRALFRRPSRPRPTPRPASRNAHHPGCST